MTRECGACGLKSHQRAGVEDEMDGEPLVVLIGDKQGGEVLFRV